MARTYKEVRTSVEFILTQHQDVIDTAAYRATDVKPLLDRIDALEKLVKEYRGTIGYADCKNPDTCDDVGCQTARAKRAKIDEVLK